MEDEGSSSDSGKEEQNQITEKLVTEDNEEIVKVRRKKVPKVSQSAKTFKSISDMNDEEKKEFIKFKVSKGKYNEIDGLIKNEADLFDYMIELMSNNKEAKRASELIVKYQKDYTRYPVLLERLEKKAVRFCIGDQPWSMVELRLRSDPNLLAIAAEDFFYRGDKDIAYSIVTRNNIKSSLKKKEILEWLDTDASQTAKILSNDLLDKDVFGPYLEYTAPPPSKRKQSKQDPELQPKSLRMLSLSDFGLSRSDVILVQDDGGLEDLKAKLKMEKKVDFYYEGRNRYRECAYHAQVQR